MLGFFFLSVVFSSTISQPREPLLACNSALALILSAFSVRKNPSNQEALDTFRISLLEAQDAVSAELAEYPIPSDPSLEDVIQNRANQILHLVKIADVTKSNQVLLLLMGIEPTFFPNNDEIDWLVLRQFAAGLAEFFAV